MTSSLPFTVIKQLNLDIHQELIVDCFAGGGGNSLGIEMALGRRVDYAINHDEDALSMHAQNHPETAHLREDIRDICPRQVAQGRPVGLLHLSPDCRDHSQSKGGQPRSKEVRGLTWQGKKWAGTVLPVCITLENVKQIEKWGPLKAKRDKASGRIVKLDGSVAAKGERVPLEQQFLVPDPKKAGLYWRRFVRDLEAFGYVVESRILCAADFDTPTTRERLFMIARRDGRPIVWPEPTHSKEGGHGKAKWRAAAEVIDWDIPCPSIFSRKKPLAANTLRRIAKGLERFVLKNPAPFIVPLTHQGADRVHPLHEPLRTVTAAHRGELALANPAVVPIAHYNGKTTVHDLADPLRTITAATKGGEFAVMAPVIAKFRGQSTGADIASPLPTVTSGGQCKRPAGAAHALGLMAPVLVQTGYGEREGQEPRALDLGKPLGTIVAGGGKHAPVIAYLAQQNGGFNETPGHAATEPMSTVTNSGSQQQVVTAHLTTVSNQGVPVPALTPEQIEGARRVASLLKSFKVIGEGSDDIVTIRLGDEVYAIVDIGLRMMTPRELYRAQGFPDSYIIDIGHDGRAFSKSSQVRMVGNSVCPNITKALIQANLPELCINVRRRKVA